MNDQEVRVRCIEAATRVPGNPNTLQLARTFYEFVTEGVLTIEGAAHVDGKIVEAEPKLSASMQLRPKGARKV